MESSWGSRLCSKMWSIRETRGGSEGVQKGSKRGSSRGSRLGVHVLYPLSLLAAGFFSKGH